MRLHQILLVTHVLKEFYTARFLSPRQWKALCQRHCAAEIQDFLARPDCARQSLSSCYHSPLEEQNQKIVLRPKCRRIPLATMRPWNLLWDTGRNRLSVRAQAENCICAEQIQTM